MSTALRVLIVEDSEADAELLLRELKRGGYEPAFERVASAAPLMAALQRETWEVVISDNSMPGFTGMEALALVRAHSPDLPFICVSGTISEDQAVAAMKAGANDYFAKGQLKRLPTAIARELREARAHATQRASEASH